MTKPDAIYLFDNGDEVVWCDTDESQDKSAVKYIRADKLRREINELKAHCERLKQCLMKASAMNPDRKGFELCLGKTLASVPNQSLAEHDARVIDRAYEVAREWIEQGEGVSDIEMTPHNTRMMLAGLGQICITANQPREQANQTNPSK